jgi:aspartate ammonia-lyase
MDLKQKYQDVLSLGETLGVKDGGFKEEAGKLKMWGVANYNYDKNRIWDKIKTIQGWENEVAADIKIANTDIYGVYTVKSGDTLSKLAKDFLGSASSYMDIFNMNKDQLQDPDKIKVGQELKIPNRK